MHLENICRRTYYIILNPLRFPEIDVVFSFMLSHYDIMFVYDNILQYTQARI